MVGHSSSKKCIYCTSTVETHRHEVLKSPTPSSSRGSYCSKFGFQEPVSTSSNPMRPINGQTVSLHRHCPVLSTVLSFTDPLDVFFNAPILSEPPLEKITRLGLPRIAARVQTPQRFCDGSVWVINRTYCGQELSRGVTIIISRFVVAGHNCVPHSQWGHSAHPPYQRHTVGLAYHYCCCLYLSYLSTSLPLRSMWG